MRFSARGYFGDHEIFYSDIEYLTEIYGLSLFAMGAVGSDDYDSVVGGIRYYFGDEKSLLRRHREEDHSVTGTPRRNKASTNPL